jgi:RNA polymerase sigma factor (sigma-70 family)
MADDDLDLLAGQAAAGDSNALDQLLRLVQADVFRICGRFLPFRSDAEEAAQDTLLAIARQITTFDGRARFTTWMYQVAANRARSTYRSLARRATVAGAVPERGDPRTTSVIAGTRLDVLEALDRLDAIYSEPVAMRDLVGLEYQDIADGLGLPLGTLKSRIHDGRKQLQRHLIERD